MKRQTRWPIAATIAATAAVALWSEPAAALPPNCGELVIDDALAGATLGEQLGGTLDASGFTPGDGAGSIVWNFDAPLRAGCVEMTVQGITTVGVGEHDLLELFTGPDGSFSDGAQDYFLLYKIAGDVFPEYEGRLKVEMGEENKALEVGTWSENLAWSPADAHTLAVQIEESGVASFYADDVLLDIVDYNKIMGAQLDFLSLRIPNNGEYQVQAALGGVVYSNVAVYDNSPPSGGATTDDGGESDGGGTGAESGVADDSGGAMPGSTSGASDATDSDGTGDSGGPIETSGGGSGLPFPGDNDGNAEGCTCSTEGPSRAPLLAPLGLLLLVVRRRRRSSP